MQRGRAGQDKTSRNHLLYLNEEEAASEVVVSVEETDEAVAGLEAVETDAGPCGEGVDGEFLGVFDFEPTRGLVCGFG